MTMVLRIQMRTTVERTHRGCVMRALVYAQVHERAHIDHDTKRDQTPKTQQRRPKRVDRDGGRDDEDGDGDYCTDVHVLLSLWRRFDERVGVGVNARFAWRGRARAHFEDGDGCIWSMVWRSWG